jgi:hypothetical protein
MFVAALQLPLTALNTINWCGIDEQLFIPKTLKITPDPPQRGKQLRLELSGVFKEQINFGAVAHVQVKIGFIQLINQDYDLCDQLPQVDKKCPIPKGNFELDKTFDIPAEAPPVC